uniref:Uncharacterized protein n=1 Tax=Chelonoidis abingdonii TaxID=106734 RepID=A0A8C0GI81_CHEAB
MPLGALCRSPGGQKAAPVALPQVCLWRVRWSHGTGRVSPAACHRAWGGEMARASPDCSPELPSSSDPPTSASPEAGITGTSHSAWLVLLSGSLSFKLCL